MNQKKNALKAIDIFKKQKENILLGSAYLILGSNQSSPEKVYKARKNYWAALACFQPQGHVKGLYSTYRWLANSYFKTPEIDSITFYQLKALSIAERLNDSEQIYQSASWVGSTFLSLGEFDKAIKYFDYGLKNTTAKTDKVGLRSMLTAYVTCLISTHAFSGADSIIKK